MKTERIIVLLFFVLCARIEAQCQPFEFNWELCGDNGGYYYFVNVYKSDTSNNISIRIIAFFPALKDFETTLGLNYFVSNVIDKKDCDSLKDILENYTFTNKQYSWGSRFAGKEYYDTELLPDSIRVVVNNDTIRKESIWAFGYSFDEDLKKCFKQKITYRASTDGHYYKGIYRIGYQCKSFVLYSGNVNNEDFKLCKIMQYFITKYATSLDVNEIEMLDLLIYPENKY